MPTIKAGTGASTELRNSFPNNDKPENLRFRGDRPRTAPFKGAIASLKETRKIDEAVTNLFNALRLARELQTAFGILRRLSAAKPPQRSLRDA